MKHIILVVACFLTVVLTKAQTIYSKAYGNPQHPALVFIHGGPSGNSNLFEGTTAAQLAEQGFYVIVYDRRGEGRSKDDKASLTFAESFADLNQLLATYNLPKAHILGHSFGGIVATLYTQQFPERVSSLTLLGALVSQQKTYDHILAQAKKYFKSDDSKLQQIATLEKLDKNSAAYRKKCYELASAMHYFTMPTPTTQSTALRQAFEASDFSRTNIKNMASPIKFYANEKQNNIDNTAVLRTIKGKNIPVYALYGKDDGIFSAQQLKELKDVVGKQNLEVIENCSHYLFVDQQDQFLDFIVRKIK